MPLFKRKSDKKSAKDAQKGKTGSAPSSPAKKGEGKTNSVQPNVQNVHTGGARPKIQAAKVVQTDRSSTQQDTQFGDLGHSQQGNAGVRGSSRLNITLDELLHDNSAIPYFIQYMDTVGRQHIIKFWIEVDSFRSAAWTRIRAHTLTSMSKSLVEQTGSPPLDRKKLQTDANTKMSSLTKDNSSKERIEDANSNEVVGGTLPADRNSVDSLQSLQSVESVRTSHSAISNGDSSAKDDSGVEDKGKEASKGERRKKNEGDSLKKAIERDAVSIYSKYIAQDAAKPIGVTDEMRNCIVAKICSEDGHVDPNCFQEAQGFVFKVMERDHYPSYLKSEFHCKHQIDVLTSGDVFLRDILYNDTALFYFMEFMEQEGAMNLLQFWLAAKNFQETLAAKQGQYDGLEAQNDAMVLYDKYFSLQATSPLGVDEATRFEIENQICREGGPLPNCFETPMRQTLTTIESMYFPTFLTSELYFKYLNELINAIKTDVKSSGSLPSPSPHHKAHRRQGSNASSEASVGSSNTTTTNTLLAGGVVHKLEKQNTKVIKGLDNDFRIDPHQFNPDQLWQRPNVGNMSVGRMNELGQFIPEYEVLPESEKNKESSASKLWKKYVSREPDAEKEEMAWKIAQMIVSDITRQTGGEELDSPDDDS